MGKGGWDKIKSKLPQSVLDTVYFWQDLNSRNKRTHISINGQETSLCNNSEFNDLTCSTTELSEAKDSICKNCLRIAGGLNTSDTRDFAVKSAKKTVSRAAASSPAHAKHKRLQAHQKALSRDSDDFMEALQKHAPKKKTIELPSEVTEEQQSLQEAMAMSSTVLTTLRRCAVLNLERVMQQWKRCDPRDTFIIIQEG